MWVAFPHTGCALRRCTHLRVPGDRLPSVSTHGELASRLGSYTVLFLASVTSFVRSVLPAEVLRIS